MNALASDLAVTWLGAFGTAVYFYFLWRRHDSSGSVRATLFLLGVLTALLFVRGFFWLWGGSVLGRLVFMAATLEPLAITLFSEHLLRRHHPRWLKLFALAASVLFAALNLLVDLPAEKYFLLAFLISLVSIALANAWLLLQASEADLSGNELRLVRAVLIAALIAVPLVVTDFRQEVEQIPVRLGGLGALLFVYVLLNAADMQHVAATLIMRIAFALVAAVVLALAFALATQGIGPTLLDSALYGLPVATAWMLLTLILVRIASMSAQDPGNRFLRWLLHARLDSAETFLRSLRRLPQTEEHLVLGAAELAGYSLDLLFETTEGRREPIALVEARAWRSSGSAERVDAAEQLVDLLESHEMTHALLITRTPPLVVLLNLPQGADAAIGQLRAGVIQRLARRMAEGSTSRA